MPTISDRVSEYILEMRIGAGAFGEVWRARHHVWQERLVAIKFPTDPQYVRNLQTEGSVVQNLVHPNIVRAIGFDPYGNPPYLVMEYVQGQSLRGLMKARQLKVPEVTEILRQILQGLEYAHEQGLVHQDMKPENVMISEQAEASGFTQPGCVKVTDFGFGRSVGGNSPESIAFSASINSPAAQAMVGTLDYMSPEQRSGQKADVRADLYACGVMLFEMLTGEKPAGSEMPRDLNPATPSKLNIAFGKSYCRLDKRYASAAAFLADIEVDDSLPPPMPGAIAGYKLTEPVVGRQIAGERICPQCRRIVNAADQFCMYCGVQLVTVVRRCTHCGAYPDPADDVCVACGHALPAMQV